MTNKYLTKAAEAILELNPEVVNEVRLDLQTLARGIAIEMEHTDDFDVALEIAGSNLIDNPSYYDEESTYVEKTAATRHSKKILRDIIRRKDYEYLPLSDKKGKARWLAESGRVPNLDKGSIIPGTNIREPVYANASRLVDSGTKQGRPDLLGDVLGRDRKKYKIGKRNLGKPLGKLPR